MLSTVIDVVIGMIFIYLLLSLMCSAANELIELWLKKRAIDLERGIREMLRPGSSSGEQDIVQKLYDHPLINNLFGKRYNDTRITSPLRYVLRTKLPSYIPARSFALALMDLITNPVPPAAGALTAAPPPSGTAGATPPASAELTLTQPPPPSPLPDATNNPLARLRTSIAVSPLFVNLPEVRQGLIALVDAAGDDVAKARENIETWFNSSMDRVSSWYKRRTQVVILILGLLLAVVVNVDSIRIAKQLSTDSSLRESLVAASVEYAKAHASPTPTATPTTTPPPGSESKTTATTATTTATPEATPEECKTAPASKQCKDKIELQKACTIPDSPKCKYLASKDELNALGLPIGWENDKRPAGMGRAAYVSDLIYKHGLGWLLTALAISLGAPFWFDLLNKFLVIRSAVKPHEKSPEEESKD